MAFVPNWIFANNPLEYMKAGAALGLQRRAQQAAEDQAFARNELAQQELEQRREFAAARAAEALRQHNALEAYRRSQISLGERELSAKEAADKLRREGVGTEEITVGGQQFARNPRTGALYAIKPPASEKEIEPLDLAPGRYRMGNQIITVPEPKPAKPEFTTRQALSLQKDKFNILKGQPDLQPGSPAAFASTNLINAIDAALKPPTSTTATGTRIRKKGTTQVFIYRGNPADIPLDQYDILQ